MRRLGIRNLEKEKAPGAAAQIDCWGQIIQGLNRTEVRVVVLAGALDPDCATCRLFVDGTKLCRREGETLS